MSIDQRKFKTSVLLASLIVCFGAAIQEKAYGLPLTDEEHLDFVTGEKQGKEASRATDIAQNQTVNLIPITKIEVVGSTIFDSEKFDPIIKPLEGKSVSLQELQKTAGSITQLYLDEGYLNSRAILGEVKEGTAVIQVVEGGISEIVVEGADRLKNYVLQRIKLGAGSPLNVRKLEDALRMLKNDRLIKNIEASLKSPQKTETEGGKVPNKSVLIVKVIEANPFDGSFGIDNNSIPTIGPTRLNLDLAYRNLTGLGDTIAASYRPRIESIGGTYHLDLSYQVPLNPMNGTFQFNTQIERNTVVNGEFKDLDINGESVRYTVNYRQPLIRNPREELALSLGFDYYTNQTFLGDDPTPFGEGPNSSGNTSTSVFTFAQEYIKRQSSGAWALRSQFRIGTDLFGATDNPGSIPDSQFFSWLGQVQRVQVLDTNNFLIIQGEVQLASSPLLSSEQFVIGGVDSVRGYATNARSADNGLRFSIEDRFTVARNKNQDPIFTIAPFFDLGYVWNDPDNPNPDGNQRFLAGLGLGLLWQPVNGLNLRVDYAPPLIYLNDRGDNIQDNGFYFSANYNF
jgi:hemolysin activation/secretion protein